MRTHMVRIFYKNGDAYTVTVSTSSNKLSPALALYVS